MSAATLLASALLVVALDQWTKRLVLRHVPRGHAVSLGGVAIRPVINARAGAGVVCGRPTWIMLWFGTVVLFLLLVHLVPSFADARTQIGLGVALGGASGNLLDRLRSGGVIDFVDVGFWPVFNLADAAIVGGLMLTVLAGW